MGCSPEHTARHHAAARPRYLRAGVADKDLAAVLQMAWHRCHIRGCRPGCCAFLGGLRPTDATTVPQPTPFGYHIDMARGRHRVRADLGDFGSQLRRLPCIALVLWRDVGGDPLAGCTPLSLHDVAEGDDSLPQSMQSNSTASAGPVMLSLRSSRISPVTYSRAALSRREADPCGAGPLLFPRFLARGTSASL
jgi:hypothetical protein